MPGGRVQSKAVQGQQARHGQQILAGQVVEVAQDKPAGVADAAVGVHQPPHDFIGKADILAVVHRGGPEADDFCAVFFGELLRRNDISHGFGHLVPFAVYHIAVGEHAAVGRAARLPSLTKREL